MTEFDWLVCEDPQVMLEWLRHNGTASKRKFRLFACACARRVWPLLAEERSRNAVEVAERYADGQASEAERKTAAAEVPCIYGNPDDVTDPKNIEAFATEVAASTAFGADDYPPIPTYAVTCAIAAARAAANAAACAASSPLRAEWTSAERVADRVYGDELKAEAALVRDVFGNPFRTPPRVDPAWLTPRVLRLAETAYDNRQLPSGALAPERLAALADVLEEAGCQDAEILGHCQQPGLHVRGCWVVDLLLGKECKV